MSRRNPSAEGPSLGWESITGAMDEKFPEGCGGRIRNPLTAKESGLVRPFYRSMHRRQAQTQFIRQGLVGPNLSSTHPELEGNQEVLRLQYHVPRIGRFLFS